MKAHLSVNQTINFTYLLPFVYYNFLRQQVIVPDQFQKMFLRKSEHLIKSKIFQIVTQFFIQNNMIAKQTADFHKIFKNSLLDENNIRICLKQGVLQDIFLVEIQLLKNNKAVLRVKIVDNIDLTHQDKRRHDIKIKRVK